MKIAAVSLTCFVLMSSLLQAQKKYDVTIKFSPSFNIENVQIFVDNGNGIHQPRTLRKINKIYLSNDYRSSYASIEVRYPGKNGKKPDHNMGFFVKNGPTEINFFKNDTSTNKLGSFTITNGNTFDELGAREFNAFVRDEKQSYWELYNDYKELESTNDSISKKLEVYHDAIINKSIEFIKEHGDAYYTLWAMKNKVRPTDLVNADSLLYIFYVAFPDNYKNSFEGKRIEEILLSQKIRKGKNAPEFIVKDIYGNSISLSQFRDKYTIINFWGTWCGPCIKEFTAIHELRESHLDKNLEFIFMNLDKDSVKFKQALEKYDLTFGYHISRNMEISKKYGVEFIPRVFLISPDGIVLYTRNEENDKEQLTKLKALLADKLGR